MLTPLRVSVILGTGRRGRSEDERAFSTLAAKLGEGAGVMRRKRVALYRNAEGVLLGSVAGRYGIVRVLSDVGGLGCGGGAVWRGVGGEGVCRSECLRQDAGWGLSKGGLQSLVACSIPPASIEGRGHPPHFTVATPAALAESTGASPCRTRTRG